MAVWLADMDLSLTEVSTSQAKTPAGRCTSFRYFQEQGYDRFVHGGLFFVIWVVGFIGYKCILYPLSCRYKSQKGHIGQS